VILTNQRSHFRSLSTDGQRLVVFGGMELESTLLGFNKETEKLEKVEYSRGDVVII
jgi:hypothetical protein